VHNERVCLAKYGRALSQDNCGSTIKVIKQYLTSSEQEWRDLRSTSRTTEILLTYMGCPLEEIPGSSEEIQNGSNRFIKQKEN
jgi:hypothetical protein